jgi:hypothetical protein
MSTEAALRLLPIQPHEFDSLLAGFEYEHDISEVSNTTAFDTRVDARDLRSCVVCGKKAVGGLHPGVKRAHIIGRTEDVLVRNVFSVSIEQWSIPCSGIS